MGQQYSAICQDCGHQFIVTEGGGFFYHVLHCDRCGKERSISFDKIGEPHARFLKGLKGPYSVVSSKSDTRIQETYQGEPLNEDEYHRAVEALIKKCRCGGHFTFSSPPRCPKCHSLNFKNDGTLEVCCD